MYFFVFCTGRLLINGSDIADSAAPPSPPSGTTGKAAPPPPPPKTKAKGKPTQKIYHQYSNVCPFCNEFIMYMNIALFAHVLCSFTYIMYISTYQNNSSFE